MGRGHSMHGSAAIAGVLLALGACGDDGRPDATGSASGTTSATATMTVPTTGDTAGSASEGFTTEVSGVSESVTMGTTPTSTTALTGDATSLGDDTTATESATDGTSGGPPPFCGQDPPKGYVGPFDASCKNEPKVGTFTPVAEWSKSSFTVAPEYDQVMVAPIVAPLTDNDGDGVYGSAGDMPAILFVTYAGAAYQSAGVLRAISGDGATELLAVGGVAACSGLAAGDIDNDGVIEIVGVNTDGTVVAWEHDGTPKWTSAAYASAMAYPFMSVPSIADMDGDGNPEIIVGRVILNNDGSLRGQGVYGVGAPYYGSTSFAVDTDNDGVQEVVVGNALYRPDGTAVWYNQAADGYPAVADFDGDGGPEIVVVGDGTVRLQTAGGGVLWDVANPALTGGPPTVADYDGDGLPEIGVAGKVGYVVFDTDGAVLWQQATQDASSAVTGSSVYDFEGDGIADVVYADEINLYVYSGIDGAIKLQYDGHNSGTLIEYPIVVDADNDGQVEIVVTHNNLIQSAHGLTVVGDADKSWRPGRRIWNQHAYNITNVDDDGGIPTDPTPNWPQYNNFRSGDLSPADGLVAPDLQMLTPEACINDCNDDELSIWVQLGNTGAGPLLAGAVVDVYGTKMGMPEELLTSVDVPLALQPGEFADAISIPVVTTGLEQIRLVATPKESECKVDMANELIIVPPFCTAPG